MTTHEVLTALFWLVAGSYAMYLGWYVFTAITRRDGPRTPKRR